MSDFPINFTISSRTLKSVMPLSLKNFAAKLVPAGSTIELHDQQSAEMLFQLNTKKIFPSLLSKQLYKQNQILEKIYI